MGLKGCTTNLDARTTIEKIKYKIQSTTQMTDFIYKFECLFTSEYETQHWCITEVNLSQKYFF